MSVVVESGLQDQIQKPICSRSLVIQALNLYPLQETKKGERTSTNCDYKDRRLTWKKNLVQVFFFPYLYIPSCVILR